MLHWRHLHVNIRDRIRIYYEAQQYGQAAREGVLIYLEKLRNKTGLAYDGVELINKTLSYSRKNPETLPIVQINNLSNNTDINIQEGQAHLSRGIVAGFRNPIQHDPIDSTVPNIFSELDCLNILSLLSYLMNRLENAKFNLEA